MRQRSDFVYFFGEAIRLLDRSDQVLYGIGKMCNKISKESLRDKAYETLKRSLMANELLPGQPLSIEELSRHFGISPTPIREALAKLMAEGLVEHSTNKTPRVAEIREEDIHQSYTVRRLLEPYAVSVAAKKIPQVSDLRNWVIEARRNASNILHLVGSSDFMEDNYEVYQSVGMDLQHVVAEALGNTFLGRIFSLVSDHSLRIRSFPEAGVSRDPQQIMRAATEEHLEILNALLSGEEEDAMKAVKRHLENAEARAVQTARNEIKMLLKN